MSKFFEGLIRTLTSLLRNKIVTDWLLSLMMTALKAQATGGLRGMILRRMVKEFHEEIVEVIELTNDYTVTRKIVNDTVDEEDRDAATDTLNDVWL